jgi:protein-S-isoprenylcysteine O-methyltransferase Ste14
MQAHAMAKPKGSVMRLQDHLSTTGVHLFRWRSYILLAFIPAILWMVLQGEQIELQLGPRFGDLFEIATIALVVLGQTIRILTVGFVPRGTSGRNTKDQLAEVLNTTGAYSLVRNPLYLGNCLMYVGIALYTQSLWLGLVMALILLPYYERIIAAEERFLAPRFGAAYDDWAAQVPAFIPRLHGFVPPSMPFSLRSVIRREQSSVFGAVVALYLIELGLHTIGTGAEPMHPGWHWVMGAAVVLKLLALVLKRHSQVLAVKGR